MKIIIPNTSLKEKIDSLGAEEIFLKAFTNSDFLVIEENDNQIIGVAGVGGLFHIGQIFVKKEHRGTGLGAKLNLLRDKEIRKRGYSFFIGTTYTKNPSAKPISGLLKSRKARPVFSFNYYESFITTLYIQEYNWKGKIVGRLLDFFNSKFGTMCLAILLKTSKPIWKNLFLVESTAQSSINICYSVKNFQKISK